MNLIAVDIGNTNITMALFLRGEQDSAESFPCQSEEELTGWLKSAWDKIPVLKSSKEKKRDGVIVVSSVKPESTETIKKIAKQTLDERIYLVGKDIPYPMALSVKDPEKVGSDRVLSAAAAYAVVEKAVVVADFGTAVTIDLVSDKGVFLGGCILPGFEIAAKALNDNTALLPKVTVKKPETLFGRDTAEAINCGLYYSAVGALEEIIRRLAEETGTWPQTVLTGAAAAIIKDDCDFIDSYVTNLVVKGIALAYSNYIEGKTG